MVLALTVPIVIVRKYLSILKLFPAALMLQTLGEDIATIVTEGSTSSWSGCKIEGRELTEGLLSTAHRRTQSWYHSVRNEIPI